MIFLKFCLTLSIALLFLLSLSVGYVMIAPHTAFQALLFGGEGPIPLVMREIRLPRAILALMIGAGLGMSGASLQGLLRNPLAEPGLLGISGSAALGAVIALQTGFAAGFALALPFSALTGALIGVLLIIFLAGARGSSLTLILSGIAISALTSALTTLTLSLSPNPYAISEIVFWMMGSLADRSLLHVVISTPLILIGILVLSTTARALDALTLGEDTAQSLGINLQTLRLKIVLGTALIVGPATAVAGIIGFVGLVVPHILRPLVKSKPSALLFMSALGGAVLLLMADSLVRVILPEGDLKLGVVTALIGAPLFLHLVYKTRRNLT